MPTLTKPPVQETLADPQALIEEARRRTRRRRRGVAAFAFFCVAAIAGTVFGLGAEGVGLTASAGAKPGPAKHLLRNGPLTIVSGDGISVVRPAGLGRTLFACGHGPFTGAGRCADIESVAWSPDGRHLAFGGVSIGAPSYDDGLYVADTKTGRDRIIRRFDPPEVNWVDLAWSPDGSTIAFVVRNVIYLVRSDGSGYRTVPTGTEGHDRAPSWSPDGRRMAYATSGPGYSVVFRVDLDGTHRKILGYGGWPAWSPRGARIAYLASCGVRIVSPNRKPLSRCVDVHSAPVWSPDGRSIAVAVPRKGIYTMNAGGTDLRLLTRVLPSSIAAWATDAWMRPAWQPRVD